VILDQLNVPVVLAPLAGGPTTPQLAAAVSEVGGLGFLAAGYLTAGKLREEIARARALTRAPLGVNVFVPGGSPAPPEVVAAYAATIEADPGAAGVALGEPRFDDDDWAAKIALLTADPLPVTSFTFGCPEPAVISALQEAGTEVWVTVANPADAQEAASAGADVLVVQGGEAGGHRGSFRDDPAADPGGFGLLALLQLVATQTSLPLVAAGGISTGQGIAAVLAAGASAAQLGTAFLRCPEAGTSAVHRAAVAGPGETAMTRAFSGRLARGIRNQFLDAHSQGAPAAYPEVHHLTAPLRAAGRRDGNPGVVNLWAGQAHELAQELPAAELVGELAYATQEALRAVTDRWG
jgi:nitronate monooxygenase